MSGSEDVRLVYPCTKNKTDTRAIHLSVLLRILVTSVKAVLGDTYSVLGLRDEEVQLAILDISDSSVLYQCQKYVDALSNSRVHHALSPQT